MSLPPDDLLQFLNKGKQLKFNHKKSEVGPIRLKSGSELAPEVITFFAGSQDLMIDDPYEIFEGEYHANVYDLVAESEYYDPEGLLCWLSKLQCFGIIDAEHGTVISFPGATWRDIVKKPAAYLDANWNRKANNVELVLPWLHFRYTFDDNQRSFDPYPATCPVHNVPVAIDNTERPLLFKVYQVREIESWLERQATEFPCAGVPANSHQMLCCTQCRAAEDRWYEDIGNKIEPLEAKANKAGYVLCPHCGVRFPVHSPECFRAGMHVTCGQIIRVIEAG